MVIVDNEHQNYIFYEFYDLNKTTNNVSSNNELMLVILILEDINIIISHGFSNKTSFDLIAAECFLIWENYNTVSETD